MLTAIAAVALSLAASGLDGPPPTAVSYVGLSVTTTMSGASGRGDSLGGFGVYWLYDARGFLADLQAGFGVSQSTSEGGGWTGISVAGLRPLSGGDVVPFVGAGVGYLRLELDGHVGAGVQLFGEAGLLFGRTGDVHFRADVRPFVTTFELTDGPGGGTVGYGGQLALGMGF